MSLSFYDIAFLAEMLDVSERDFNGSIKPIIVKDFRKELAKIKINNPDILLDEDKTIYLADPGNHKRVIKTQMSIFAYKYV